MGLFSVWFLCSIVQQFGLLINSELPLYIYLWLCISILYEAKNTLYATVFIIAMKSFVILLLHSLNRHWDFSIESCSLTEYSCLEKSQSIFSRAKENVPSSI